MKLKLFLMATLLLAILIILLNFSRPILTERVQDIAVHQSSSVERYFIENVWRENLNKLTYDLAMHLRSDRVLMQSIQDLANDASASELQNRVFNRLTYHLNTGFFTGGYVQPMHLAAYDAEFNPLVMHLQDVDSLHLARPLSVEYVQRLKARSNVEAMQVFDLLEVQEDGTVYYSVMIPVGLYKAEAYLELRINPIYNLKKIGIFRVAHSNFIE